jgi:hypothetical protein
LAELKEIDLIKLHRCKKTYIILLIFVIYAPVLAPNTMAQSTASPLQDKAYAFLADIVQLDLTNYTVSENQQYKSENHISLSIDAKNASFLDSMYHINAVLNFYNDSVRSCDLSPGLAGLPYANRSMDRFQATVGFMERYQEYTGDAQVKEMVAMLEKVSSEKNVTQPLDKLTLRISGSDLLTTYSFLNTFNGVEYNGISISYGNGLENFYFNDNRQTQKIGDTDINISRDQAISIGEKYLKTYTMNFTFGNGTTVLLSNFNVTGVYQAVLQTSNRGNNTLYPNWNIQYNISNMPTHGLQGIGVWISANDGSVWGAYDYTSMNFDPFLNVLFLSIFLETLTPIITVVCILIAAIIVVVLLIRKNGKTALPPSNKN